MKIIKLFGFIAVLSVSSMQATYHVIEFNSNPRPSKSASYNEFTIKPVQSEAKRRTPYGTYNGYHTDGTTIYFTDFMDTKHVVTTNDKGLILATNLYGEYNSFLYNDTDRVSVARANLFIALKRLQLAEKCLEIQRKEENTGRETTLSHVYYAPAILANMANIKSLKTQLQELKSQLAAMLDPVDSSDGEAGAARRK